MSAKIETPDTHHDDCPRLGAELPITKLPTNIEGALDAYTLAMRSKSEWSHDEADAAESALRRVVADALKLEANRALISVIEYGDRRTTINAAAKHAKLELTHAIARASSLDDSDKILGYLASALSSVLAIAENTPANGPWTHAELYGEAAE